MPGDLNIGGGVYIYIPSGVVDYWPVTGVTQPQHQWEFAVTGGYTDVGSTGGLDLVAGGSGNSFSAAGLVLTAAGYATANTVNADVNNVGTTFSLLSEIMVTSNPDGNEYVALGIYGHAWWIDIRVGSPKVSIYIDGVQYYWMPAEVYEDNLYQIIITFAAGHYDFYVNGSWVYHTDGNAPTEELTYYMDVGHAGWNETAVIKRAGVLKGTCWSADDIAAIYSSLS